MGGKTASAIRLLLAAQTFIRVEFNTGYQDRTDLFRTEGDF